MLKDNPSRVPLGRIRNPLPSSLTLLYTAFLYFSRIAFTISGMQVPYLCTMLNLTLLRFPFPFYVTSNPTLINVKLGLLHTLIAWGLDVTKQRKHLLAIPVEKREKYDIACIEHFQKSEDRFIEALHAFGITLLIIESKTLLYTCVVSLLPIKPLVSKPFLIGLLGYTLLRLFPDRIKDYIPEI